MTWVKLERDCPVMLIHAPRSLSETRRFGVSGRERRRLGGTDRVGRAVRAGLPKLADPAKGFDFASRDLVKNKIEFDQRRVAFDGIERRCSSLRENESFAHRLFAGLEIREQRIPAARTIQVGRWHSAG